MKGWQVEFHKKSSSVHEENPSALKAKPPVYNREIILSENKPPVSGETRAKKYKLNNKPFTTRKRGIKDKVKPFIKAHIIYSPPLKNEKEKEAARDNENRINLVVVYALFIVGLASLGLVVPSLINAWGIAALLIILGITLLIGSVSLSVDFLKEIRKQKLPYKKWPYKLIISFGIVLISAIFTGIFILLLALIFNLTSPLLILQVSIAFFILSTLAWLLLLMPD